MPCKGHHSKWYYINKVKQKQIGVGKHLKNEPWKSIKRIKKR